MRLDSSNILRISRDSAVFLPAVGFTRSQQPEQELRDIEELESIERLGEAYIRRHRRTTESACD